MLTIFSCPKPFRGHINIIQRNAIKSWTFLQPKPEIILIGDEEGTAEICNEFGLHYIPDVERNEYGTPLVNSLFEEAEEAASYQLMCYVNADIILMSDFTTAVLRVTQEMSKFLMVGQRWDIDVNEALDFSGEWEEKLISYVDQNGKLHAHTGIDFFVFPKGLFEYIPTFAIGRTAWDGWLLYYASIHRAKPIDATFTVMAIHQNHDYLHSSYAKKSVWKDPEAKLNLKLAGGWHHQFTINDARYILTPDGLKTIPIGKHIKERLRYLFIVPVRKRLKTILKRE